MKKIILFTTLMFVGVTYGQTAMSRTIEIKEGQMSEFIEMAGKKTKMYNGMEDSTQFFTWRIMTGPNAGKIWRVEVGESLASFDENPYDSPGGKYWQKNVSPLTINNNVNRTVIWGRADGASWSPDEPTGDLMRRAIFYTYKSTHEQEFWRYRQRIAEARKAVNDQSLPATSTWWCGSGCDENTVVVFFSHADFEDAVSDQQKNQAIWDKYDELYGSGSHEQDVASMLESIVPNGNRIRHLMLIPEASSGN